MTEQDESIRMAVVHRPCSTGVDLPAGASAADLQPTDYHVVEMPDVGVEMARIHRPGDEVVELPPGATADQLARPDCRVVEVRATE
jgi:hypothetical protein